MESDEAGSSETGFASTGLVAGAWPIPIRIDLHLRVGTQSWAEWSANGPMSGIHDWSN